MQNKLKKNNRKCVEKLSLIRNEVKKNKGSSSSNNKNISNRKLTNSNKRLDINNCGSYGLYVGDAGVVCFVSLVRDSFTANKLKLQLQQNKVTKNSVQKKIITRP